MNANQTVNKIAERYISAYSIYRKQRSLSMKSAEKGTNAMRGPNPGLDSKKTCVQDLRNVDTRNSNKTQTHQTNCDFVCQTTSEKPQGASPRLEKSNKTRFEMSSLKRI